MSKTLSWIGAEVPSPLSHAARRAAAAALRSTGRVLARLARRLRKRASAQPLHPAVIEFHAIHRDAGAPEGALYIDGELVGTIPGVTRL